MQNPAGKECPYFYGDYYRGRSREECRLVGPNWVPHLCTTCIVPEIIQANACKHQVLRAEIKRPLFFLKPRVEITAYCTKCQCHVEEPHIGCGQCHLLPPFLMGDDHETDPAS